MHSLRVRSTPHNGHRHATMLKRDASDQTKPTTKIGCRMIGLYGKPIHFRLGEGAYPKGFFIALNGDKVRNQEVTQ